MRIRTFSLAVLAIALTLPFWGATAQAQATRTWVSGVGDDANPCSRTAPCKTFAGAIAKTAAFGEINCLDPGGFGAVTITKSILIDCSDTLGGVLVSGTNGIVVSVATTDVVTLRGLDIEGVTTGLSGVAFISAGTLHIEQTRIRGFNSSSAGFGIKFTPNNTAALFVDDTLVADNGTAAIGDGILIAPTAITATANVALKNVRMTNDTSGFKADGTSGPINVSISDSLSSGNRFPGISIFTPAGGSAVKAMINGATSSNNSVGLRADGAAVTTFIGSSTISGNGTGLIIANGATLNSYKTNQLDNNTTAISGTLGTGTLQ